MSGLTAWEALKLSERHAPPKPDISGWLAIIDSKIEEACKQGSTRIDAPFEGYRMYRTPEQEGLIRDEYTRRGFKWHTSPPALSWSKAYPPPPPGERYHH